MNHALHPRCASSILTRGGGGSDRQWRQPIRTQLDTTAPHMERVACYRFITPLAGRLRILLSLKGWSPMFLSVELVCAISSVFWSSDANLMQYFVCSKIARERVHLDQSYQVFIFWLRCESDFIASVCDELAGNSNLSIYIQPVFLAVITYCLVNNVPPLYCMISQLMNFWEIRLVLCTNLASKVFFKFCYECWTNTIC